LRQNPHDAGSGYHAGTFRKAVSTQWPFYKVLNIRRGAVIDRSSKTVIDKMWGNLPVEVEELDIFMPQISGLIPSEDSFNVVARAPGGYGPGNYKAISFYWMIVQGESQHALGAFPQVE